MGNTVDFQRNQPDYSSVEALLNVPGLTPTLSPQAAAFIRLFEQNEENCTFEYGVRIFEIEKATENILARTDLHPLKDLVYRYRKLPDSVVQELDHRIVSIMTNLDSFGDVITIKRMELKRENERKQKRNTIIQFSIGATIALIIGILMMISYI